MIQAPYEVSKFLKLQMLLSSDELERLFDFLGVFELYDNSRVVADKMPVDRDDFLKHYASYFTSLMGNKRIPLGGYALTGSREAVTFHDVGEGGVLVKAKEPVIQLREHTFIFGQDGKFHSNVHGEDVVRWGIEFNFPQIFVDPETKKVHHVLREERFTNGELFRKAMKWMRHYTKPVPFNIEGRIKRATFRIGLLCIDQAEKMHDMQNFLLWREA